MPTYSVVDALLVWDFLGPQKTKNWKVFGAHLAEGLLPVLFVGDLMEKSAAVARKC